MCEEEEKEKEEQHHLHQRERANEMQRVMRVNSRFTYTCSYPPSERIGSQFKCRARRASKFPGDVRLLAAKRRGVRLLDWALHA